MKAPKLSKILISPDKFKYSLTGEQICRIISEALPKQYIKKSLPLADGGDGSIQAIKLNLNGQYISTEVHDPLFRKIRSTYLMDQTKQKGFVEMAKASGLQLLKKSERNPLKTSTFGTGELLSHAIKVKNAQELFLMIGGSATNDGGIGMAAALGYQFYDQNDRVLSPIGQNLPKISVIRTPDSLITSGKKITIMTDVKNPLCGNNGASAIYGPQKGATPEDVRLLDQGLSHLDSLFEKYFGRSVKTIEGSGGAGGLGAGALVFLDAQIQSGIQTLIEATNFKNEARESDLIITGEGKVDGQTLSGKVIDGVINVAKSLNKRVIIFCGKSQIEGDFFGPNVQIIPLLNDSITEQYCIRHAEPLLREAVLKRFSHQL